MSELVGKTERKNKDANKPVDKTPDAVIGRLNLSVVEVVTPNTQTHSDRLDLSPSVPRAQI